ncbi:MAG TPA: 8-amino-7-oxononanoate synthase, partial [Planctomycetaceae bacterium]|nr:8-amino-7-oxononanoate synthase [Planctomycetaceae bacterium]
ELANRSLLANDTSSGPIIPVILEEPERTMAIAADLQAAGFLVGAIRP